ncbi:hypothetical protein GBAR_LOCUS17971 [Geodia barretti]|uniref:Uncharacterized protein n=1 Tax=Geodia barretti TaxID=519541 RepID=A0AA35SMX1_GEOBA|nr:hypothetical protein GBAR_LOCUS17971 [Geodia barretti]
MGEGSGEDGVLTINGKWYYFATFGIVLLLLLLTLFCVTFTLLCAVLRRLRELSRSFQALREPDGAVAKMHTDSVSGAANKEQSHSEEPLPGTEFSNTGTDPSNVADLYATVPEEHRQKKKMAKLCIQQYDDINLLPLESRESGEGEDESKVVASITIERGVSEGYSRLCHAGPRMNSSKRFGHPFSTSTPQLLDDSSERKDSFSSSVKGNNMTYSEVEPMRPRSTLIGPTGITGSYSMIKQGEDGTPPPLPGRINQLFYSSPTESGLLKDTRSSTEKVAEVESSGTEPPIPYQNIDRSGDPAKIGAGYSMVANPASPPRITDGDFFGEVMEFHNLQAVEGSTQDQLYEKVK